MLLYFVDILYSRLLKGAKYGIEFSIKENKILWY